MVNPCAKAIVFKVLIPVISGDLFRALAGHQVPQSDKTITTSIISLPVFLKKSPIQTRLSRVKNIFAKGIDL
jgi:hypothetical protein